MKGKLRRRLSVLVAAPLVGALILAGPYLLYHVIKHGWRTVLFDFHGGLYKAGVAIVHGRDPYRAAFLAHQAARMRAGHVAIGEVARHSFSVPVYPAIANLFAVPFTLVPLGTAGIIFAVLSVAAMACGLWLLGVRDWRCLLLALLSWPFLYGAFMGTVGPLLVLGLGVAWRWRGRIWPPAAGLATIVAVKLFPWTLGVWLLVTRRYKALTATVALGLVITFGAWAVIGWHGLGQYPQMVNDLSFIQENRALSVVGVLVIAGVSATAATIIALLLGLLLLLLAWAVAHRPDGDRRAFGLAVLAALTATPIVWEHYMMLLFVPIALVSPNLSAAWLIPLITPAIDAVWLLFPRLYPAGPDVPFTPNTLRSAIPWLVSELLIAALVCSTPQQRRGLLGHRRVRAGTAEPLSRPAVAATRAS
jgi:hypothetical protein